MYHPYPNNQLKRRQRKYDRSLTPYNFYETNFQGGQPFIFPQQYQIQQELPPFPPLYQSSQPLYHEGQNGGGYINNQYFHSPYPTPYPKPAPFMKQQPSSMQTIMSQFKKSDGQLDFNKMIDTAGQMMSAFNQMGGLFKGVTSIFK